MGWVTILILALLVFAGLWWFVRDTAARQLLGAALFVALAGYAWQGQAELRRQPEGAAGPSADGGEPVRPAAAGAARPLRRRLALADDGGRLSAAGRHPHRGRDHPGRPARRPARRRSVGRARQCAGHPRQRHDEPGGPARLPARGADRARIIPAPPSSTASRSRRAAIMPRRSGCGGNCWPARRRARPIAPRSRNGCARSTRRGRGGEIPAGPAAAPSPPADAQWRRAGTSQNSQ